MGPIVVMTLCAAVQAQTTQEAEPQPPLGQVVADSRHDAPRAEDPPDTGLMYHLTWYGADYAVVAALLGASFGVAPLLSPAPALLGPRFDDDLPDFAALDEPANLRLVGAPYREDTVPTLAIYVGGGALALSALGYEGVRNRDWHRGHNLLIGGLEAVALTLATTEALKLAVGRLRPDFRDRATRYYCNPEVGRRDIAGLDCSQADADGVYLDAGDLEDGHQSFPSGHSSSTFALATYFALFIGGESIWGQRATWESRMVGAPLAAGLFGLAAWVAATRVTDGRHHLDDVAAGAAIGTVASTLAYFLHFDAQGRAVYRGVDVAPVALNDGMALRLAWAL